MSNSNLDLNEFFSFLCEYMYNFARMMVVLIRNSGSMVIQFNFIWTVKD